MFQRNLRGTWFQFCWGWFHHLCRRGDVRESERWTLCSRSMRYGARNYELHCRCLCGCVLKFLSPNSKKSFMNEIQSHHTINHLQVRPRTAHVPWTVMLDITRWVIQQSVTRVCGWSLCLGVKSWRVAIYRSAMWIVQRQIVMVRLHNLGVK